MIIASTMKDIIEANEAFTQLKKQYFLDHVLYSHQWWFLVALTITIWVVWMFLVDKYRLVPICLIGLFTGLIAIIMDDFGITMNLWNYQYKLSYLTNQFYTVDLAVIPVSYMLLYQYVPRWKNYIIVLITLSLFGTFIAEPFFVKLDIYVLLLWQHWYSTPIYILIGIIVKWITDNMDKKQCCGKDTKDGHNRR